MRAKGHMDAPGSTAGCPLGIPVGDDSMLGSIKGVDDRGSGLAFGDKLCIGGLPFDPPDPPRRSIRPVPRPACNVKFTWLA
jgi:hypothetical protein